MGDQEHEEKRVVGDPAEQNAGAKRKDGRKEGKLRMIIFTFDLSVVFSCPRFSFLTSVADCGLTSLVKGEIVRRKGFGDEDQ